MEPSEWLDKWEAHNVDILWMKRMSASRSSHFKEMIEDLTSIRVAAKLQGLPPYPDIFLSRAIFRIESLLKRNGFYDYWLLRGWPPRS